MIVPAIVYRDQINDEFKKLYYTNEMLMYAGCIDSGLPDIIECDDGTHYQYAVIDSNGNLCGYIAYQIDWYALVARNFGLISFHTNVANGEAVDEVLNTLISKYHMHKITWRMISGNPVERTYDRFCKKWNGRKHVLLDEFRDREGKYRCDVIYEIFPEDDRDRDV